MTELDFLAVRGADLVDTAGSSVRLAGVGLGGWMNMENFITGYPGSEGVLRRLLPRPDGQGGVRRVLRRLPA